MTRLFGTDGIRGVADVDVTVSLARAVAHAAVAVLDPARPLVVVGRDPRPSGPSLAAATVDGLLAAGADVVDLGIIPTPAVAHALAAGLPGIDRLPSFGVVISASHNPAADNGIKLFGRGGSKLSVATEDAIEQAVSPTPPAATPGKLLIVGNNDWYADHLIGLAGEFGGIDGLRIVLDCANGAASDFAPAIFAAAGAIVTAINTGPGELINDDCGATHLDGLRRRVVEAAVDMGLAFDGDADRCLAVDHRGVVADGDFILAILAASLSNRDLLPGNAIAATVMSNQGLVVGLAERGIEVRRTDVGDRAVLERMAADGLVLGGEQSGHIVLSDYATTGDGMLTGLALAATVSTTPAATLADLSEMLEPMPQVLINVRVADKAAALAAAASETAVVEAELGEHGRVLVRPSGTEPLLRVMVEATSEAVANEAAARIVAAVGQQAAGQIGS